MAGPIQKNLTEVSFKLLELKQEKIFYYAFSKFKIGSFII